MERTTFPPGPVEEISIFCPVRLYMANRRFDGLLDTLDGKGGSFFVLTDDDASSSSLLQSMEMKMDTRGELALGAGANEIRIPFRVRGMRIDEDGLYAYAGLDFLLAGDADKRRLEGFVASLW